MCHWPWCRPSVRGCLKGFSGLLDPGQGSLQSKQVIPLVKALLDVHITALAQADRMLALGVLLSALQVCLIL